MSEPKPLTFNLGEEGEELLRKMLAGELQEKLLAYTEQDKNCRVCIRANPFRITLEYKITDPVYNCGIGRHLNDQ